MQHAEPLSQASSPAYFSSATTGLTRAKGAVTHFIHKALFYRKPSHKRVTNTGARGFNHPGDTPEPFLPPFGDFAPLSINTSAIPSVSVRSKVFRSPVGSRRSKRPFRMANSVRSRKSVFSVRSVNHFGSTPSIFLTLPSSHNKRKYRIHRGSSSTGTSMATSTRTATKRARYAASTVSTMSCQQGGQQSSASLLSDAPRPCSESDRSQQQGQQSCASLLSDAPRPFSQSNRSQHITHGSDLDLMTTSDCNNAPEVVAVDCSRWQRRSAPPRCGIYQAYNPREQPTTVELPDSTQVAANHPKDTSGKRDSGYAPAIPQCLAPGPSRTSLALPPDPPAERVTDYRKSGTFGYGSSPICYKDTLQFIPYSRDLDIGSIDSGASNTDFASLSPSLPLASRVERNTRLSQIYASVERLEDTLPDLDKHLLEAPAINSASTAHKSASYQGQPPLSKHTKRNTLPAAHNIYDDTLSVSNRITLPASRETNDDGSKKAKRITLPASHKMNDNGYPLWTEPVPHFSSTPSYQARSLSAEEKKLAAKEERRRTLDAGTAAKHSSKGPLHARSKSLFNLIKRNSAD